MKFSTSHLISTKTVGFILVTFLVLVQARIPSTRTRDLQPEISIYKGSSFPLPECAGDCDEDDDCLEGLVCWQRDPGESIPGCEGGEDNDSRTDYCIRLGSESPSSSPTATVPTAKPTPIPTSAPSTAKPTVSFVPSTSPSTSPSAGPTPVINTVGPFQLKLHWTTRSCWQDICRKEVTKWCMQCEGYHCNEGDIVWIEPCRDDLPYQQLFTWNPVLAADTVNQWGQLQVQDSPDDPLLCLQQRLTGDTRYTQLRPCNETIPQQWYQGFDHVQSIRGVPFEIHPNTPLAQPQCLTMPHHPRQFEEIYHTACTESRGDKTAWWKVIWPLQDPSIAREESSSFNKRSYYKLGAARRNPRCSEKRTCGMCQGHCSSDAECNGSLKCFRRGSRNAYEAPPGCYGSGVGGMDYCYARNGN